MSGLGYFLKRSIMFFCDRSSSKWFFLVGFVISNVQTSICLTD